MATRFVRIDLTDEARDFRPIAIEPGVPLLDRSNSNSKVLFRWVGGLAAEPSWEGDSVNFFVRDDAGGRLEEVDPQIASREDLEGLLKDDVAALRNRIEAAKPETSTERALKKTLQRCLADLLDNPHRTDLDDYFFRYRDVHGRWRLVWCWGYQRVDQEPAAAVVCTDPDCGLLFVRRPGQSAKCPACEKAWAARPKKKQNFKAPALLLLLLLLLLGAGWYWWTHPTRLIAEPDTWSGPAGARIDFVVVKAGLFRKEDVSRQVVPIVLDPQVARLDPSGNSAVALSPGKTLVRFHLGKLHADATLVVGAARMPQRLSIEPASIELGVGTTARPKVIGHYDDDTAADLSDAVQWSAEKENVVYAYNGLLEGISEGASAVRAAYRATPEAKPLEASATVTVANVEFESLEMAIEPPTIAVGRRGDIRLDAVSTGGKRYSVIESSMLTTVVAPPYLARVQGRGVVGENVGRGKLAATFAEKHTAGAEFEVVGTPIDRLAVYPEEMELAVGEIADLSIAAPPGAPVKVTSAKPEVVEISAENRLIGRQEGAATVEVSQGSEKRSVEVSVRRAEFSELAFDPARLVVPVDDTLRPRVTAQIEQQQRRVELAPDLVGIERAPSPRYADVERRSLAVRGVRPTEASNPQTLAVRLGNHQAAAPVEVVVAPLRLTLSPPGPIDLPLGQMMRLNGWATYSGGRRVLLPAERLEWRSAAEASAVPGLELRGSRVAALKAGAGPLPVYASYFGRESNRVAFRSVEAGDVALRLEVDRPLRLAGETGAAMLWGSGPKGDVELVPELARFTSSNETVVAVDETSGVFRAAAPGKVTLTASHAAAKTPATLELSVFDPADARLVFDPAALKVAVDQRVRLPLYLEVKDGPATQRVPLVGPGVGYSMTQPQAIRWQPPWLVGLSPAKPFELTASFAPILSRTASATIEVVPSAAPEALRVVPAQSSLAAGQTVTLRVEEQLPGAAGEWREVSPEAVSWNVPPLIVWSAPEAGLRPAATLPEGAAGEYELRAAYGGQQAVAVISVKPEAPDANAAGAKLVVVREPEGYFVPAGGKQRYQIMIERDGAMEPAAGIVWPEAFENEFVAWQPPVLSAMRGGYEQQLRAEVGGRAVLWRVYTYEPSAFERAMPRGDEPVAVMILSDQITGPGQAVRFPVGAEFDDFRVEARYADGFTRIVTKKATLRTPEPPQSAVLTASSGRLIGVRPGATTVSAEFDGVTSQQPLSVEVAAELDIDQIRLAPAPITMLRGETLAMEAVGYKNGKSVGLITGVAKLNWQSSNPQVAQVTGPSVVGVGLGQASVTAAWGNVVSQPAPVAVVATLADPLAIEPKVVRLRVGESARIGPDVAVFRGELDVSRQVEVTPLQPDVVRYDAATRSLVGVSPGLSAVAVAMGDKLANVTVEVSPGLGPIDGVVVVEPASAVLAPGQAIDLRVYVLTPAGARIDRTESAVLSSSDAAVRMMGNKACAVASGAAQITATLPGTTQTGAAAVNVNNEEVVQLLVDPPQVAMSVGDVVCLRVMGRAASGTHELYPQPDLTLAAGGPNAAAIRVVGPTDISGLTEGQASVTVGWKGRLAEEVLVTVTNNPWTSLAIEPAGAAIYPGQAIAYQVTAMRGGQRRVLDAESGVQLFTGSQEVAQPVGGLTVRGSSPGQTTVVAQLGNQRAETSLTVLSGTPAATDLVTVDPRGYVIRGGRWRGGRWIGGRWVEPGGLIGVEPGVVGVPSASVAGLRFVPDVMRMSMAAPPQAVRVVELLADGTMGRDVSADPGLELTEPPSCVQIEKTAAGPALRPVGVGQTRIGARLGTLTADPLLVEVGERMVGTARLEVTPDPLTIWSGEEGQFASVRVNPGGGQMPFEVEYKITAPPGQGMVTTTGDKRLRGVSPGTAAVVITAFDPSGAYNGLTTTAMVQVGASDQLVIEPGTITLQVGETSPPLAVMAVAPDGTRYQVPAVLESADPNVLAPEATVPGRFVAKGLGETQLRADYRGRTAFAEVVVSGKRFVDVRTSDPQSADGTSFEITIEVLAAESEGPLEYRVYGAGQQPPEAWVPAQLQGDARRVTLRSPRLNYGPRGSLYHLVIEARSPSGPAAEQYPLTFRLKEGIERVDRPN